MVRPHGIHAGTERQIPRQGTRWKMEETPRSQKRHHQSPRRSPPGKDHRPPARRWSHRLRKRRSLRYPQSYGKGTCRFLHRIPDQTRRRHRKRSWKRSIRRWRKRQSYRLRLRTRKMRTLLEENPGRRLRPGSSARMRTLRPRPRRNRRSWRIINIEQPKRPARVFLRGGEQGKYSSFQPKAGWHVFLGCKPAVWF